MKRLLLTLTCILTFYGSIQAQFSGPGLGTEDAPYRIFNADQLNQVRNFLRQSDVYFILEADIDMTDWIAENNPSQGWTPIGTVNNPFSGKLNGNGYRIKNLMINRPETDYIGLFGCISNDCEISNITIENANYIGRNYVGGLAGFCDTNSLYECTPLTSCSIYGIIKGNNNVGGVVGKYNGDISTGRNYLTDRIEKCFSYCQIKGNENVGGIIGASQAIGNTSGFHVYSASLYLGNCYSTSDIYGMKNVGGIIGNVVTRIGTISINSSYVSSFIIEGEENIGGILGCSAGSGSYLNRGDNISISKCFIACENIVGNNSIGGIVGFSEEASWFSTTVSNSVAINKAIYAKENLYRICPENMDESSGNLAWTLTQMVLDGEELLMPEDGIANGTNTGLSALKLKATYQGLGWDFDNIWQIRGDEDFPYLKVQTANLSITNELHAGDTRIEGSCIEDGTITVCVDNKTYTTQSSGNSWGVNVDGLIAGEKVTITVQAEDKMPSLAVMATVKYPGEGTKDSPYLVSTAKELHNISDEGFYKLTTDINLSDWPESNGWSPIGDKFLGISANLDGNGHTISGLCYDTEITSIGLFSKIAKDGAVKNLKIKLSESCALTDESIFGAIASVNNGTISNCEVTGLNVTDGLYVGGIIGENTGIIECCHTEGVVKTKFNEATRAGGICGNMPDGIITNCYSDVSLYCGSSETYVGGIVGYTDGTVNCCYATGTLEGDIIGGIAGFAGGSSGTDKELKNCFALNENLFGQESYRIVGGNSWVLVDNNYAREDLGKTDHDTYRDGKSLPVSELKTQDAYENAGWDFENVWKIDEGTSWPYQEAFNVPVTAVSISEAEASIESGKTLELSATITPDNVRNKTVTWSSSDENVATVSQEGVVTAVKAGEATITATTNDGTELTASCTVTVTPKRATDIKIDKEQIEMEAGTTATLKATVLPEDAGDRTVTWSSSDENVATVNQEGIVTAIKAGEATITATTNDGTELTASCTVTVTPKRATDIKIDKEQIEMEAGTTATLKATVLPEDAGDRTVTWSSSDETVATVSQEGVVTAVKAGEATITATTNDGTELTASCTVKVNETSGIDDVYAKGVTVTGGKGRITISGAADNATVAVYTMNGTIIFKGTDKIIDGCARGIYIVKTSGKVYKVAVK